MINFLLAIGAIIGVSICAPFILIAQSIKLRNKKDALSDFYLELALALDRVGGTLLFLSKAKTISAVVGKLSIEKGGKYAVFEKFINWIFNDEYHCRDAYLNEFKT